MVERGNLRTVRMEHDRWMLRATQASPERYLPVEARRPSYDRHWYVLESEYRIFSGDHNRTHDISDLTVLECECQFGQSIFEVLQLEHGTKLNIETRQNVLKTWFYLLCLKSELLGIPFSNFVIIKVKNEWRTLPFVIIG